MAVAAPTREELASSTTLDDLYRRLDIVGMGPGWSKPTPSLWSAPRKTMVPARWRYEQARGALDAAGGLISTELAERRNLILFNPVEGNTYATVRTLIAAYQMIMPGEWAREHRHTPNALRLILDAEPGTYTAVDGVNIPMEPGDVLLTPNWSTHGHGNKGKACAYWLDFLDAPLVQLLEPMFFEPRERGGGPADTTPTKDSPFVFPYSDTIRRLDEARAAPDGPFATSVELGNPALLTTGLHMMRLSPDVRTSEVRTTANNIYAVANGKGVSTIDGEQFDWSRGDVIAVPAWRPHFHEAKDDAVLLRVTDEPMLKSLGFYRVETV
jgi:gentisate 1,2-dioxygenase